MTSSTRYLALASLAAIVLPGISGAQSRSRTDTTHSRDEGDHHKGFTIGLALGPGISVRRFTEGATGTQTTFALAGGLFRGSQYGVSRAGFLPAFKLSIFPTKLDVVNSSADAAPVLQTIKLRAEMAGIGYTAPITDRLSLKFSGVAGYSFNGIESGGGSKHDARLLLATPISTIDNGFVWETTARVWQQITSRASLIGGVSFRHSRPELHFANGTSQELVADQVHFDAGVAFTLFQYHRR